MAEETEEAGRDVRLLQRITLRNILSFGPNTPELELRALNVLIGPNGSGKSNLLAALGLLPAIPNDLLKALEASGNRLNDWFWQHHFARPATLAVTLASPDSATLVRHEVSFKAREGRLQFTRETISTADNELAFSRDAQATTVYKSTPRGQVIDQILAELNGTPRPDFGVVPYLSILAQLRDPSAYPSFHQLTTAYQSIFFFRNWSFGSESAIRQPRPVSAASEFLQEGGNNLALVLHQFQGDPDLKERFVAALGELYEGVESYDTVEQADYIGLYVRESGQRIPATRLSDGTLRYLCLLAILLHPTPPPLICLEEPELGLHPDAVLAIGRLIKEASERTQLIISTHSDILVDVLGQQPEDIIVCEKHEGATRMTRHTEPELRGWLERYSISELWTRGHLGGNRW